MKGNSSIYESGYTGNLTERELLRGVDSAKEKIKISPLENYMSFQEAMSLVKKMQPYEDPSDPEPRFANDLHATIADKLGLEDYKNLHFYTAVGSHLDKWHGVDAFVEMKVDKFRSITVTLDVTTNPNKGDDYKADVVFLMPREGLDPKISDDKARYQDTIEDVSGKIVDIIRSRIKDLKH